MLLDLTLFGARSYTAQSLHAIGQVAQLVERGPEKAGVGGSIPSLATNNFNNLAIAKNMQICSREQYANIRHAMFALSEVDSSNFHMTRAVLLVLAMCCRASLA
jgi:hypothetical protein